jgi:DNA-binding SARP family transcriptional activator/tetratricopeptide (TPR) repeat protein
MRCGEAARRYAAGMDGPTVRLAGAVAVLRDGIPQPDADVGSRKARLLLALLSARRDRTVPLEHIVETVWPEGPPRRPPRAVATLVSRLRATLGPDAVHGGPHAYRLGRPPAIRVDLDEAAHLLEECRGHPDPQLAATTGRAACDLLGSGPALAGELGTGWVLDVRAEHAALVRAARHATARALLNAGRPAEAAEVAALAGRADPLDETAVRLIMAAGQAAGEPARALAAYESLRAALADELGVDPAPETRTAHLAVLAETSPDPVRPPTRARRSILPGRTAEITELTRAWSAATAGEGGLLLVVGEGGIGKTRLAAEAEAEARSTGGHVIGVRCYASERSLFLQPLVDGLAAPLAALPAERLRDLLGPRTGALAALFPDLAAKAGPATIERGSPEVEVRRAFEAVAAALRGLAAQRPVLLVLDDLHNAGLATVEFLHFLSRRIARSRLLVLATLRPEEGGAVIDALREVAGRLDVGPLPPDAVRALALDAGRPEQAEEILRRTRGHTLFVVETLRWRETGPPESLQAVVVERASRLGSEVEEVVRAGAVLGATVDPAVVAGMLGVPPYVAAQRCAQAVAGRLLVVAGRHYEFVNDLVHEVLYATTPAPVRVAHHRSAADLSTRRPEVMAGHAAAAHDWPRAARAYLLAGEQALERFAVADSAALLSRALDAAEHAGEPELRCRVLLARGRARQILGAFHEALVDFRTGLATARQAADRRHEMLLLRELGGHTPTAVGLPVSACIGNLRDALTIAESLGDRAVEAALLGRLAVFATNRLRFAEALRLAKRAEAAGRAAHSDRALAHGLDALKNVYAYLGETDPLARTVDRLRPLLSPLGDLEYLPWVVFEGAFPALAAADWEEAERRIDEAVALSRSEGIVSYACCWFVAHLGWVARLQGRLDDAVAHGWAAVELVPDAGPSWFGPAAHTLLAATLLERDERDVAISLVEEALRHAGPEGAESYHLRCLAPLAELTGDRSVLVAADALLQGVTAPPGAAWLLGSESYLSVARAWLRHGDPARARGVLGPLLGAARRLNWLPVLATAGLVDGRAAAAQGDPSAADALIAVAELAGRTGMPLVAASARQAACGPAVGQAVP